MRIFVFALLVLCSAPALADSLSVDRAACKALTVHRPLPDVTYQAGIDVHGNDVVPADLGASPQLGDTFTIPLTVDLAASMGIPMGLAAGTKATVAHITVDGQNVYLDGQPLTDEQEDNLAVLCLEDEAR